MATGEYSAKQKVAHRVGARVPVLCLPDNPQCWIENERWARYLSPALKMALYILLCCATELVGMVCLVMYRPLPQWRDLR